jgi:biotin operon repressor
MTNGVCPRCKGTGVVPLFRSAQRIYDLLLAVAVPLSGARVARELGLSLTNTDNHLIRLEAAGLVRRIQANRGYEWAASDDREAGYDPHDEAEQPGTAR